MNPEEMFGYEEPVFIISVAARMLGVRTQTLRYYERLGLIAPSRSGGNQRVFSRRDIERVQHIRNLMDELGVNLAGVEVVMTLLQKIQSIEEQLKRLQSDNNRLRRMIEAHR